MIDLSKVYPRLKETYSDEEPKILLTHEGKEVTLSLDDSPIMKPFAQNLVVSYALDMGTHYQFISNKALSNDLTIERLHDAALKNMINEIAENIQAHGDKADVLMITNGGNYEAAMLIWDDIWAQIEAAVGDDFYVAIPARDLLYISPKNNPDAIERLGGLIKKMFDESEDTQGLMVRHIYQRADNGWEVVATA